MNDPTPNLFTALFDFRPRGSHTPEENFLSEAFAYVLKTSKSACDEWLSEVLKRKVTVRQCNITTRKREKLRDGKNVFPDMLIEATLSDDTSEKIYCEHKWRAPCDSGQLIDYYKVAKEKNAHARIVFIGSNLEQRRIARNITFGPEKAPLDACFLWEDVYRTLEIVKHKDEIFRQFLEFMKTHALNPGEPISSAGLIALPEAARATRSLRRAAERLAQMNWNIIPRRYGSIPGINYGKWGVTNLTFSTAGWLPGVDFGFLVDTTQGYEVALTKPSKGIDLMLRIASHKDRLESDEMAPVRAILLKKLPHLKETSDSALIWRQEGNGCPYSLLIVQKCLADVIGTRERDSDQIEAMYQILHDWLTILFSDGTLDTALIAAGLNGEANAADTVI